VNTSTKTFSPRPRDIDRRWYVIDADGAILGRLASEVAKILRGKHKPIFAPHADTGDHVIVVNARGVRLSGGKEAEKIYWRHSGYPGGIRGVGYAQLLAERPSVAVEKAIKGMLPKNRLGRQIFGKLAVYEGPDHPHQAQQPAPLRIGEIPRWEGLPAAAPPRAPAPKPAAKPRAKPRARAATAKGRPAASAKPATATKRAPRTARATPTEKAATKPRATTRTKTRKEPSSG
jgi:large subunit ribosomal protein L13